MHFRAIFLGLLLVLSGCGSSKISPIMCNGKNATMQDVLTLIESKYDVDYIKSDAEEVDMLNFEFEVSGGRSKNEIRKVDLESFALLLLTINTDSEGPQEKPSVVFTFVDTDDEADLSEVTVGSGLVTYTSQGDIGAIIDTETYQEAHELLKQQL